VHTPRLRRLLRVAGFENHQRPLDAGRLRAGDDAFELGAEGVGVVISQVVPPPSEASVPVVAEYREAAEKLLNKKDYSFTSLEAYIGAKVIVEAIRRAGPKITRESFRQALDSMSGYDAGGFIVGFSPKDHNGSSFVELTIIGKDGRFKY